MLTIEERKERNKSYYEKNKEKAREYYQKNKDKLADKQREYRKQNKDKINAYARKWSTKPEEAAKRSQRYHEWRENNWLTCLLYGAQTRCNKGGMEFNITKEDIYIPTHCPYLGVELTHTSGKGVRVLTNASLDRIDSTKGYIKGNVQVISALANTMKNSASIPQLIEFARGVLEHHSAFVK